MGKSWQTAGQACPTTPSSLGELCPGLLEHSTEQALARRFLEGIDGSPHHQCPHPCCLFSSSPALSRWLFPTFLASVPARRPSTPRDHPPSVRVLFSPGSCSPLTPSPWPLATLLCPRGDIPPLGTPACLLSQQGACWEQVPARGLLPALTPSFSMAACHQLTLLDKQVLVCHGRAVLQPAQRAVSLCPCSVPP